MVQKLVSKTLLRYIVAGGLSYAIELSCLFGLHKGLNLSAESSTAIAFWVGLASSFILQKLLAFKDYRKTVKALSKQLVIYSLLVLFNYGFTLLVVGLFPERWLLISRTLALITTTVWNYVFYKYIFRADHQPSSREVRQTLLRIVTLRNRYANWCLLIVPIVVFDLRFLLTGNKIIPGDPDYYFQLYGAFRRSVLDFHQFPMLDAWIGGGVPLFANIQFGLVSLQAPFILLFGSVMGWKLAVVGYQLVAFFGFRKLFSDHFKATMVRANLLAYIPVFGGFFTYRTIAGHFTFLLLAFFPWLVIFFFKRTRLNWLWFSLVLSFMIWSAPHYTTIMSVLVLGIWYGYDLVLRIVQAVQKRQFGHFWRTTIKVDGLFLLKAGVATAVLSFYRMYFVYSYIRDYPRPEIANEPYTGIVKGLGAIWWPDQYNHPPHLPSGWGWTEASAYIGLGTLLALLVIGFSVLFTIIKRRQQKKRPTLFSYSVVVLAVLFTTFFVLGMGNFGHFSPYALLYKLPVFNNMRVATRWLEWASLFALFTIAAYKNKRFAKLINFCVFLAVVELFFVSSRALGPAYFVKVFQYRSSKATFNQEYDYRLPRPQYSHDQSFQTAFFYDRNLYETTQNNLGQVIADDSLLDTRQPNSTIRCGENQGGCNFISQNARLVYWSPDKVILQRTAGGPININMNPGRGWTVNGRYAFAQFKIIDARAPFIVTDPSKTITLQYAPKYSPQWVLNKL